MSWVCWAGCATTTDGTVRVHAEGAAGAPSELVAFLQDAAGERVDGGVAPRSRATSSSRSAASAPASSSSRSTQATAHHFDLRLEVDGVMRSWAVPEGPVAGPGGQAPGRPGRGPRLGAQRLRGRGSAAGGVIVWDRGTYEQGGRVAWPEALDRGHAVFVLHGEKLRGGFALQRTRRGRQAAVAADQAPRRARAARLRRRRRASRVGAQRPYSQRDHWLAAR